MNKNIVIENFKNSKLQNKTGATMTNLGLLPPLVLTIPKWQITVSGNDSVNEFIRLFDHFITRDMPNLCCKAAHEIVMLQRTLDTPVKPSDMPSVSGLSGYFNSSSLNINTELQMHLSHNLSNPELSTLSSPEWGYTISGSTWIMMYIDLFDVYYNLSGGVEQCAVRACKAIVDLQERIAKLKAVKSATEGSMKHGEALHELGEQFLASGKSFQDFADSFEETIDNLKCGEWVAFESKKNAVRFSEVFIEPAMKKFHADVNINDYYAKLELTTPKPVDVEMFFHDGDVPTDRYFKGDGFVLSIPKDGKPQMFSTEDPVDDSEEDVISFEHHNAIVDELTDHILTLEADNATEIVHAGNIKLQERVEALERIEAEWLDFAKSVPNPVEWEEFQHQLAVEKSMVKSMVKAKERSPCNWKTFEIQGGFMTQALFYTMTIELSGARKASGKHEYAHRQLQNLQAEFNKSEIVILGLESQVEKERGYLAEANRRLEISKKNFSNANEELGKANGIIDDLSAESDKMHSMYNNLVEKCENAAEPVNSSMLIAANRTLRGEISITNATVDRLNDKLSNSHTARKHFESKYTTVCTLINRLEIEIKQLKG